MPPKHQVFNAVMSVEPLPYYNNNNNNTCRAVRQCNVSFDEPERKQDQFCSVCLLIQRNNIRQLISQGENEVVSLWSEVKRDSFRSQALFILTTSREASLDCVKSQYISESSQQPVVGCCHQPRRGKCYISEPFVTSYRPDYHMVLKSGANRSKRWTFLFSVEFDRRDANNWWN